MDDFELILASLILFVNIGNPLACLPFKMLEYFFLHLIITKTTTLFKIQGRRINNCSNNNYLFNVMINANKITIMLINER